MKHHQDVPDKISQTNLDPGAESMQDIMGYYIMCVCVCVVILCRLATYKSNFTHVDPNGFFQDGIMGIV